MKNFILEPGGKIVFGGGCVREYLAGFAREYGPNVLLVSGVRSGLGNGARDEVTKALRDAGKRIVEFPGIRPGPDYQEVQKGAQLAREQQVDLILGVGGGSVIDCWAKELSIESLQKILPTAEAVGVDYSFEVCNRYEQFLFNTAKEAVAFAEATGSPRAKVHLDTYHMNIEEDNMYAAIAYAGVSGRLGHLHVGESNRRIPGVGASQIDWAMFGKAVNMAGYQGAIIMEPFVLTAAHNAVRTRTWRSLSGGAGVDKLIEDARTGGRFLRSVLTN